MKQFNLITRTYTRPVFDKDSHICDLYIVWSVVDRYSRTPQYRFRAYLSVGLDDVAFYTSHPPALNQIAPLFTALGRGTAPDFCLDLWNPEKQEWYKNKYSATGALW
jgi:hypothetical protein